MKSIPSIMAALYAVLGVALLFELVAIWENTLGALPASRPHLWGLCGMVLVTTTLALSVYRQHVERLEQRVADLEARLDPSDDPDPS